MGAKRSRSAGPTATREVVGGEGASGGHGALEVHFPGEAAADLDWLQPATERLGEGALDEALEPSLELLESHGRR